MIKEKIHILHLEDTPEDAELVCMELDRVFPNIEIEHVTHKQAYSEALRTHKADLIISDYDVPGFSGIESLEMRNQELPEVPFIFLSGAIGEERAISAMRGGASDYVMKDNIPKLPLVVDRLLRARWEKKKRKEAQAAALDNEQRYQQLFKNASDAIFIFNADSMTIEDANDQAQRYLGYEREELIGLLAEELTPQRYREIAGQKVNEILIKGSLQCEHVHVSKHGKEIPVIISANVLNLNGHKVIQAFVWNLTEQKKTEEEFRIRDRAFASVDEGIIITDPNQIDNPIIFSNQKFTEITGYEVHEVIGKNCRFLQGKNTDRATAFSISKAVKAREIFHGEVLNYRKDGTTFWNDLTITPVFDNDGELQNYIGLQRDITERKQNEQELKRLSLVASSVENAVYITDPEFNSVWVNKSFERLTGFSMDELQDKKPTAFYNAEAFKNPNMEEWMTSLFQGSSVSEELWLKRKDGLRYWAQVDATPVMNEKGSVEQIIAIMSDITIRKNAELERDNLLKTLEEKVIERTTELSKAYIQLEGQSTELQKTQQELQLSYDSEMVVKEDLQSSIRYAKRLHDVIFPSEKVLNRYFKELFIFDRPHSTIGGDFYWCHRVKKKTIMVCADCTGHGVPGAFMSLLGANLLDQIIIDQQWMHPSLILELLDNELQTRFQTNGSEKVADGMDMTVCVIDTREKTIDFAGALNHVVLAGTRGLQTYKGSRFSIGAYLSSARKKFETISFPYQDGDMLYMMTDGFQDQFGGEHDKRFMFKQMEQMFSDIHSYSAEEQQNHIADRFNSWKGSEAQIDDVLVMGMRL